MHALYMRNVLLELFEHFGGWSCVFNERRALVYIAGSTSTSCNVWKIKVENKITFKMHGHGILQPNLTLIGFSRLNDMNIKLSRTDI